MIKIIQTNTNTNDFQSVTLQYSSWSAYTEDLLDEDYTNSTNKNNIKPLNSKIEKINISDNYHIDVDINIQGSKINVKGYLVDRKGE
jgi:hypothetical protein